MANDLNYSREQPQETRSPNCGQSEANNKNQFAFAKLLCCPDSPKSGSPAQDQQSNCFASKNIISWLSYRISFAFVVLFFTVLKILAITKGTADKGSENKEHGALVVLFLYNAVCITLMLLLAFRGKWTTTIRHHQTEKHILIMATVLTLLSMIFLAAYFVSKLEVAVPESTSFRTKLAG